MNPESDLIMDSIIKKAAGLSKIKEFHLEVAFRLSKIKKLRESLDTIMTQIDLDKLIMVLLGFGGIFKFILMKKKFAPRELVVELGLRMNTVREWINSALEMNIIEKVKTVHGAYLYQLNKRVVLEHLIFLRNKIIEFTGIETEDVITDISINEAFNVIREALAIIMPLKENLRQLSSARFDRRDLERLSISGPALTRWIENAERLNIIQREDEEDYVFNTNNFREFLGMVYSSIRKLINLISD